MEKSIKSMPKRARKLLSLIKTNTNWDVHSSGDGKFELENWSPAGENIIINVNANTIKEDIEDYYWSFDPDKHATDLITLRNSDRERMYGIPTASVLIEDAYRIDDMLEKLYICVMEW